MVHFAERLGAPVLTTPKCEGAIPEAHPLRAGCIIGGLIERNLINQSNLIVAVGLDAVELQPKPWPYTLGARHLAGAEPRCSRPADPEIVGDMKSLLAAFVEWRRGRRLGRGPRPGPSASRCATRSTCRARPVAARAIEVARAVLPRDTIATCDAGASRLLVVQKWEASGRASSWPPMGWLHGLSGARRHGGAARPSRPPVVAFAGDGGSLMAVAELQTAAQKLPIIVVVFDDEEIGLIRVEQEIKGIPLHGVKLGGIDWEKIGTAFGADATVVDTEKGLGNALAAAVKSGRTTVIGARIDPSGYVAQFNALREL